MLNKVRETKINEWIYFFIIYFLLLLAMDISADLKQMGVSPVAVVSAGLKTWIKNKEKNMNKKNKNKHKERNHKIIMNKHEQT